MNRSQEKGFTLIELSIVLVIIGLIVGGVLVGQDLIRAAEKRAAVAQLQSHDTAVNAFKDKYNGNPGDLATADAFLPDHPTDGAPADGDGDGVIEGSGGQGAGTDPTSLAFEIAEVYKHLGLAGMVERAFEAVATGLTADNLPQIQSGVSFISIFHTTAASSTTGANAGHRLFIGGGTGGGVTMGDFFDDTATAQGLTADVAFYIDSKMDDGNGVLGLVRAVDDASMSDPNAASSVCLTSVTTGVYDVAGDEQECQLAIDLTGI